MLKIKGWMSEEELERLKDRYRPYSNIKPRITMIRLIVALDLAYKYIKEAQNDLSIPKDEIHRRD